MLYWGSRLISKRTEAEKAVVERYLDELYPDRRESNENDRSTESTENTENTGGDVGGV